MWESYFSNKTILITGGTGFLGTALVWRLASQTHPKQIYLLCRGGKDIIHAASSINLVDPLRKLSQNIIGATERLAHIALGCPRLQRFVYISTAFANSHLYAESEAGAVDIPIQGVFYPLSSSASASASTSVSTIWQEVQTRNSSAEYEAHDFPWPCAYAKHLSERLLAELFAKADVSEKSLILRPSILGPAERVPYAGYSVTADEVPVDVVVDRLLLHLVHGSAGCVHAVSGERGRYRFKDLWEEGMAVRKMPWRLRLVWADVDWHSPQLHYIARFYVLFGHSFDFSEERTLRLWERVPEAERRGLRVFKDCSRGFDLGGRRDEIRACAKGLASYFGVPSWVAIPFL
ncbi:hypothetical protein BO71DRAFT_449917 [Aspergillus ellipticus CBS 707.79]|uniref:Fatty acyl-CoA reductase n=1 Tax=Aspergillus ellipticus CBS 707.79 TaxID=1448320 RepID=A0A319DBL8_9EURO|nr:hypothetical protein BO71DRAFT_449917 [Aspergillus ellipticus CBS 707.79]